MKNFDIIGAFPYPPMVVSCGVTFVPGRGAPEFADHDAIVRLEARRDDAQVADQFASLHIALLDDVVLVHEPADSGRPGPPAGRGPAPAARFAATLPIGRRILTNMPGNSVRSGFCRMPRTSSVPVA